MLTTEAAKKIDGGGREQGELLGCHNKEAHLINMSWSLLQLSPTTGSLCRQEPI